MTETMRFMNMKELTAFIEEMEDNTVISIAEAAVELTRNGKVVDYEPEGWWNIAKLSYADTNTLLFNYYGGGYPFAYPIDGNSPEESIEYAVRYFMHDCDVFKEDCKYIVDTETIEIMKNKNMDKDIEDR